MGAEEREALQAAFDSNWIAPVGPHVVLFEEHMVNVLGGADVYAVALTSATAGLHLALLLLGVGPGDRVFVSTFTFAASANPICYCGAEPVFLDCEASSWNLDPDLLAEALAIAHRENRLPKAVIAVDLYGQCADYARIRPICEQYGVPLIQDSAESLGAYHGNEPAGLQGDLAVFSFNGNKILTTGGGGILLCRTSEQAEKARFLAAQAREAQPHYEHREVGYNYRLCNLLAAVGNAQLSHLEDRVRARRENYEFYQSALRDIEGLAMAPVNVYGSGNYWLSCITLDPRILPKPEAVRREMERQNIETRPLWKPMHLQPVFEESIRYDRGVSESLFLSGLCLPSGSAMTDSDRNRVVSTLREAFAAQSQAPTTASSISSD